MGIRDRVLDILFDDEEEDVQVIKPKTYQQNKHSRTDVNNTGRTSPVFLDATSPTKLSRTEHNKIEKEKNIVPQVSETSEYQIRNNISPIYGVIGAKPKPRTKPFPKTKAQQTISEIVNRSNDDQKKKGLYPNIVISPIYGPLANKTLKRVSTKTHKKHNDEFDRDINDTGNFETLYPKQEESSAPNFDDVDVKNDVINEELGDTDRLLRISDKINKIKNEAAFIYDEDSSILEEPEINTNEEQVIEKEDTSNTISKLIHNFQRHDVNSDSLKEETKEADILLSNINKTETVNSKVNEISNSDLIGSDNDLSDTEDEKDENVEEINIENNEIKIDDSDKIVQDEKLDEIVNTQSDVSDEIIENEEKEEDINDIDDGFKEIDSNNSDEETSNNFEIVSSSSNSSVDDVFDDKVDDDLFSDLFGDD